MRADRAHWRMEVSTDDAAAGDIQVGDLVRVKPYRTQAMDGSWSEGYRTGKLAIVRGFGKSYRWVSNPDMASLRLISQGTPEAPVECWNDADAVDGLELVTRGPGRFVLGETHPYSEREVRQQRWDAWIAKCLEYDSTHEGWSNPATWCANLALTNDKRALDRAFALRRKDGSINPHRLEKVFREAKLTVDKGFFDPPFDPPEGGPVPLVVKLSRMVNWQEIADDLANGWRGRP